MSDETNEPQRPIDAEPAGALCYVTSDGRMLAARPADFDAKREIRQAYADDWQAWARKRIADLTSAHETSQRLRIDQTEKLAEVTHSLSAAIERAERGETLLARLREAATAAVTAFESWHCDNCGYIFGEGHPDYDADDPENEPCESCKPSVDAWEGLQLALAPSAAQGEGGSETETTTEEKE